MRVRNYTPHNIVVNGHSLPTGWECLMWSGTELAITLPEAEPETDPENTGEVSKQTIDFEITETANV